MSLPTKVKIGPTVYAVQRVQQIVLGKKQRDSQEYVGLVDLNKEVILVVDSAAETRAHIIFWHEIFHAIYENAGEMVDEGTLDMLATGVVQVLMDNPIQEYMNAKQSGTGRDIR